MIGGRPGADAGSTARRGGSVRRDSAGGGGLAHTGKGPPPALSADGISAQAYHRKVKDMEVACTSTCVRRSTLLPASSALLGRRPCSFPPVPSLGCVLAATNSLGSTDGRHIVPTHAASGTQQHREAGPIRGRSRICPGPARGRSLAEPGPVDPGSITGQCGGARHVVDVPAITTKVKPILFQGPAHS